MTHFPREDAEFLRKGLLQLDNYNRENSQFLDRMRHSSCFEHVQKIKGFVGEFSSCKRTPEEASGVVREFVEEMAMQLSDHPLWRNEEDDSFEKIAEALEKYLLHRLYKITFSFPNSTDAEDDKKIYLRARQLQFLSPSNLDISEQPLNKMAFHLAAEELVKLDGNTCTSPLEKVVCVLNSTTILSNLLKHYGTVSGTGADEILPYIIYTLLLLSPKHIYSHLRFIQRFRRESKLQSEAAYYCTQMESAVLFLSQLTQESLSISSEEFTKGMLEGEKRINSKKDVPSFVPRTYLWARYDSSPSPTRASSKGGGRGGGGRGGGREGGEGGRVSVIMEEWKELGRQRLLSFGDKNEGEGRLGTVDTQKLLNSRFEHLTITDLQQMHANYKSLLA